MAIIILASLLIIGLILLLAEVIFIPGTTVVGVLGLLVSLVGVFYAFALYDQVTATWITAFAATLNLTAIFYGFNSGVWNKFSLKSSIKGGAYDDRLEGLESGMIGKSVSDIKPFGKVQFGESVYEVKSEQGFISVASEVSIIKIENNKILVKNHGSI
jgi:membrane-bound ClpP family serine protease